jgi:hypothetical protein
MMRITHGRVGLIAACAALIGAAACNKDGSAVADDSLVRDLAAAGAAGASGLELAPSTTRPQVVVSAIEAGETSAQKRAAPKQAPHPASRATPHVAKQQLPTPTAKPSPVVAEAPSAPPAAEPVPTPAPITTRPTPAPAQQPQQRGVYKTEAEIFRQMPWIRP